MKTDIEIESIVKPVKQIWKTLLPTRNLLTNHETYVKIIKHPPPKKKKKSPWLALVGEQKPIRHRQTNASPPEALGGLRLLSPR